MEISSLNSNKSTYNSSIANSSYINKTAANQNSYRILPFPNYGSELSQSREIIKSLTNLVTKLVDTVTNLINSLGGKTPSVAQPGTTPTDVTNPTTNVGTNGVDPTTGMPSEVQQPGPLEMFKEIFDKVFEFISPFMSIFGKSFSKIFKGGFSKIFGSVGSGAKKLFKKIF